MAEKLTRQRGVFLKSEDGLFKPDEWQTVEIYEAEPVDALVRSLWALVEKWRFESGVVDDLVYKASGELACCADEMAVLLPAPTPEEP